MNNKSILKIILSLSIAGVLFAGFLTFTKLILGFCPLKESCPYLLGYPVCVYGLIFFTIILISTIMLLIDYKTRISQKILLYTSVFGVAFSLYYSFQELFILTCPGGCEYTLGMPSCIYGLIMYTAITILYIYNLRTNNLRNNVKKTNTNNKSKKNKKQKKN